MILRSSIQEWASHAPWPNVSQIEQDLIISRALCDLFNHAKLKGKIAFRGGTAIHKLLFGTPLRYSEDIDLVQMHAEPIGDTIDAIRDALSWLGHIASRKQAGHSMHLFYEFEPDASPGTILKLKIEINTREHRNLYPLKQCPFSLQNSWYQGETEIVSFEPEELFGTKLRALLQRRKNRDLFDLHEGHNQLSLDPGKVIECFQHYLALQQESISRAQAEERMLRKLEKSLSEDIAPLLPVGVVFNEEDALAAFSEVWFGFITKIEGNAWKSTDEVVNRLRQTRLPNLLR